MLTNENYYSANEYMSYSQYKMFAGCLGRPACEEHALKVLSGEWVDDDNKALIMGSYVDAYFSGELDEFIENNQEKIFNKKGDKYADFVKCDEAIERCKRDDLFMQYMGGEPQKIFTGELFGTQWKSKLDSYHKGKAIVDLKYIKDISETFYVKDFGGHVDFITYWGYAGQLAIYQKLVEINTGEKLPCYICAVDKTKYPNIEIIQIPNEKLKHELSLIEFDIKHVLDVKNGVVEPLRCGKCDYCKSTKKLTSPILLDELGGV